MEYTQIGYEVRERIATVTLNRPEARNGYTIRMADEAAHALGVASADDDVRVIVLTGAGDDFCVGADLSGGGLGVTATGDPSAASTWTEPATRVTRLLYRCEKPVIAAIRGAAVGVGSTMILPADYRIVAADSRFGFVFSRRGIYPEGGSTWFLPRLVGMGRALDWMISGRLIPADEALAAGLVTAVHPSADVLDRAYELARDLIAKTAPVSTAVIRQALYRMSALDSPEPAFALDSRLIASCAHSADAVEGVVSFLERRPPAFRGHVTKDQPEFLPWHSDTRTESTEEA
ncbi:enoyl-CoA hydratase-related protein [Streptomyces sp. NBC_01244]|uniref:enoyl-CoA hydratase-related protein n=1 Tax=Streptomyces sp. NBC_01244 TaxID=2903797 RepID=UPI002E0FE929|nr:enoyl-CoA hydratase-related protein [Streptomyces sp. NBC_01244]